MKDKGKLQEWAPTADGHSIVMIDDRPYCCFLRVETINGFSIGARVEVNYQPGPTKLVGTATSPLPLIRSMEVVIPPLCAVLRADGLFLAASMNRKKASWTYDEKRVAVFPGMSKAEAERLTQSLGRTDITFVPWERFIIKACASCGVSNTWRESDKAPEYCGACRAKWGCK